MASLIGCFEPANYDPLYKPQSGAIRYLTGPEITYPGVDLANFLNFFGKALFSTSMDHGLFIRIFNCSLNPS